MNKIKNIIYILLIIFFMISIVPKELQNDTFFTIANGRLILENGLQQEEQLVWHKDLNFSNPRWLFDILITIIYNKFDFNGIYIFVVIFAILEGLLYYTVLNKITKNKSLSFFFTIISMYELKIAFTARAQIISNLFLLIEFYCLENIKTSSKLKMQHALLLLIMPIIFANMHASTFPIYLIVFIPYIIEYIAYKIKLINNEEGKLICETKNFKAIIILFIISLLEGFVFPFGLVPYTYMFKNMNGISSNFIIELQPIKIFDEIYFTAVLISTISILIFSKQKFRISDGLFILGFAILAFNNFRSYYYFVIISSICFIRIFTDFLNVYEFEITKTFKNLSLIFGICFIIVNSTILLLDNIAQEYIGDYPVEAVDYICKNINVDQMRIYNHFNFGSYLELKGIKAFVDSRSEIYTEEFNPGCTILQDWFDATNLKVNYNDIFDQYEITHVLLYDDESLTNYIKYDPKWKMLYQDEGFILYERVS